MDELHEHYQEVLSAVIEEYFITACPVGSKFVANNCPLSLSSASIRNIMADMEERGYLSQPHFSAGRVPTPLGYKLYIESILKTKKISRRQKENIKLKIDFSNNKDIKNILKQTIRSLSDVSHYTGVVLAPEVSVSKLLHIEFIKVGPHNILVVIIFEGGIVENRIILVDKNYDDDTLVKYSRKLNSIIEGHDHNLDELREIIIKEMLRDREDFYFILNKMFFDFNFNNNGEEDKDDYLLIGSEEILFDEPEFASHDKIKSLLKAFNDKKTIIKLLELTKEKKGTMVFIGSDTEWSEINGLTLITAPYKSKKGHAGGSIGVIGPARMNYSFVIPVVDYMAELLSEMIMI